MKNTILTTLLFLITSVVFAQKTAEEFFNAGFSKYEKEDFDGAVIDFDKGIKLNPNVPNAYYLRALCKIKYESTAAVIPDFDKAIALNPKFTEAYL